MQMNEIKLKEIFHQKTILLEQMQIIISVYQQMVQDYIQKTQRTHNFQSKKIENNILLSKQSIQALETSNDSLHRELDHVQDKRNKLMKTRINLQKKIIQMNKVLATLPDQVDLIQTASFSSEQNNPEKRNIETEKKELQLQKLKEKLQGLRLENQLVQKAMIETENFIEQQSELVFGFHERYLLIEEKISELSERKSINEEGLKEIDNAIQKAQTQNKELKRRELFTIQQDSFEEWNIKVNKQIKIFQSCRNWIEEWAMAEERLEGTEKLKQKLKNLVEY